MQGSWSRGEVQLGCASENGQHNYKAYIFYVRVPEPDDTSKKSQLRVLTFAHVCNSTRRRPPGIYLRGDRSTVKHQTWSGIYVTTSWLIVQNRPSFTKCLNLWGMSGNSGSIVTTNYPPMFSAHRWYQTLALRPARLWVPASDSAEIPGSLTVPGLNVVVGLSDSDAHNMALINVDCLWFQTNYVTDRDVSRT